VFTLGDGSPVGRLIFGGLLLLATLVFWVGSARRPVLSGVNTRTLTSATDSNARRRLFPPAFVGGPYIEPHDLASFTKVIQINLIGTFLMMAKSAIGMQASQPIGDDGQRGVMICTSSVAAQDGQIGQVAYSASKGGVASMTLPVARDLSRDGIRVVTIMPGLFLTPMFAGLSEEAQKSLAASVPFPSRLGDPSEYAALAVHICENAMINGECIRLDGSLRMAPR
jgi:NAD(P)-dependent dehydrogenase (short-subunit alcohol dehydrogenase family)